MEELKIILQKFHLQRISEEILEQTASQKEDLMTTSPCGECKADE